MIGIYKITSPTGKIYIGQSMNINNRLSKYRNGNCVSQVKLHRSIVKYGWESHLFEIVEECDISELNDKERYYQDLFDCVNSKNLNCRLTTTETKTGKLSEDMKERIRKSKHGKIHYFKGKKHKPESIEKMRISSTGKKFSEATKLKMSIDRKGIRRLFGYTHSEETKKRIGDWGRGRKPTEKHIKSLLERNSKLVLNIETGIFYESATEASEAHGLIYSSLISHINGTRKVNRTNFIYV